MQSSPSSLPGQEGEVFISEEHPHPSEEGPAKGLRPSALPFLQQPANEQEGGLISKRSTARFLCDAVHTVAGRLSLGC